MTEQASCKKSQEIISMTLISDNQPSEILKPGETPLDFPAAFISPQLSAILSFWLRPVAAMWRDQLNTLLFQKITIDLVTVVCFVANEFFRLSGNEKAVKGRFDQLHFMRRSTCKAGGDRKTGSVRNCHDPAAFAPFCPANGTAPFFAGTKLPSMNASRRSIPPRSCNSSAGSSIIRQKNSLRPVLESSVAGLVRRVSVGQALPRRTGAQQP